MWVLFSLLAAIFAAFVIVLSKAGISSDMDPTLVFGVEVLCMLVITWSVIISKNMQKKLFYIDRKVWIFIISAGILTTFSSLASFHSLKIGVASRTSSFEKVSLIFSVLLSIIFLKDKFNWQIVTGVLLMVAGSLFIAFAKTPK